MMKLTSKNVFHKSRNLNLPDNIKFQYAIAMSKSWEIQKGKIVSIQQTFKLLKSQDKILTQTFLARILCKIKCKLVKVLKFPVIL